jgi:C4-dicarboxylate-specific signal transduction histidine kinase
MSFLPPWKCRRDCGPCRCRTPRAASRSCKRRFSFLSGYAVAVTAVGAAVVGTLGLGPAIRHTPTLFFCSVMLSSWLGGVWPGILASVLSAIALDYYFIPPLYALGIGLEEAPDVIVFVLSALFVSWLNEQQKRAKDSIRQARDELDARVQERTAELKQINEQLQAEIAERKIAEDSLVRAQAEAAHASRLAVVGELTASIAHELNQPLAAVQTNAQAARRLLAAKGPQLGEVRAVVEDIIRDNARAAETIRNVRALFQRDEVQMSRVDLRQILCDVERIARPDATLKNVALRLDLPTTRLTVMGNRTELIEVLMNLVVNAFESVCESVDGPREVVLRASQPEAGRIQVAVSDSGKGIEPEVMPRLFDAFFTTKSKGMGMGLAIVRSIIENHGGRLRATRNSDRGATFEFNLPVKADLKEGKLI